MKIPKTFKLFAETVKVIYNPILDAKEKCIGQAVYYPKGLISIQSSFPGTEIPLDSRITTFFHELFHFLFYRLGYTNFSNDETLVTQLSGIFCQVFLTMKGPLDNPSSFEMFGETIKIVYDSNLFAKENNVGMSKQYPRMQLILQSSLPKVPISKGILIAVFFREVLYTAFHQLGRKDFQENKPLIFQLSGLLAQAFLTMKGDLDEREEVKKNFSIDMEAPHLD